MLRPGAPSTYLQPAVQTREVTVGPEGGLEGMQEQGGVGAMGRVPGRAQLVGHSEELGLHLQRVQQQHGAGDTEGGLWVGGDGAAAPLTSGALAELLGPTTASRARRRQLRPGERQGAGSRVPVPRAKLMVHSRGFFRQCCQRTFESGTSFLQKKFYLYFYINIFPTEYQNGMKEDSRGLLS